MVMESIFCYQHPRPAIHGRRATMTDQITPVRGIQRIGGLFRH
jgi:hypothetical protein